MILTKDQILEASDLTTETVPVPEWGGEVIVRTMTGTDRDAFDDSLYYLDASGKAVRDVSNLASKLLAMTIVDEAGNRLFGNDDIAMLGRKSAAAIQRVYVAASRLNGIGVQADSAAEKNSASGQSYDSGTGSPATSENPSESASAP